MAWPLYVTAAARADLVSLPARDHERFGLAVAFLRALADNPRPAGATDVREGLLRAEGIGGCTIYWEDLAIRGRLTVARIVTHDPR